MPKNGFDAVVVGAVGIDTNVYLYGSDIDFDVEANFSHNLDYIGLAGGYSSRLFASMGKKTAIIGCVGEDYSGKYIKEELDSDGIDIRGIFNDPQGTKRSINFMYRDGRRKNFYDGKGSMEVHANEKLVREIFEGSRVAHFNIVNWSRYLLPIAKEMGLMISCDIQDMVSEDDDYRKEFIEYSDILFFSSVNFDNPTYLMTKFLDSNPERIVVCGRGAKGCALGTKDGIEFFDPVELEKPIIDTNGAGDSLAVGFLSSYIMDGYSLNDSILRGQITARNTCSVKASSKDLITKSRLDEYYKVLKKMS